MAPCVNRRSVWERSTHKGPKHGSMSDPDGGRLRSMAAGGLGRDYVAVMQTTESRQGDNLLSPQRHRHCHSTNGRVFPKSEMRPVLVVITNVIFEQSPQVPLIENDHVVEQVSTYAPDPALRHPVLPRTAKGGAHGLSAIVFHRRNDIGTEFRITIEDEKSGWWFETPSFAQLEDDPEGIRLPSYAAVQDLPPVVTNDKEAIQNAECECGHGKKVHRCNGLAMVSQECQPALGDIWRSRRSPERSE